MSRQPIPGDAELFTKAPTYELQIDGNKALAIYAAHPEQAVEFVQLAAAIFTESWLEKKKEEAKGPLLPLPIRTTEKAKPAGTQATGAQT